MNEKQLGLLVISPMIVGTAALLWYHGAMGWRQVVLIAIAVTTIATYFFLNF